MRPSSLEPQAHNGRAGVQPCDDARLASHGFWRSRSAERVICMQTVMNRFATIILIVHSSQPSDAEHKNHGSIEGAKKVT